jgi:hypothetical protein
MIKKTLKIVCLSASLLTVASTGYSAALKPTKDISPIEKALNQQKLEGKHRSDNNLKVMTSLNIPPAQSFFAEQNQKFSRFIQTLFAQNNS